MVNLLMHVTEGNPVAMLRHTALRHTCRTTGINEGKETLGFGALRKGAGRR